MPDAPATILVFDSGLGGLTVYREIAAARPDAAHGDVAGDAGFPECVLDRLLDHVADPSSGARNENAKRKWRHVCAGYFIAHKLLANLRSVAMDDTEIPSFKSEVYNRAEAFSRVTKLVSDCGPLSRR